MATPAFLNAEPYVLWADGPEDAIPDYSVDPFESLEPVEPDAIPLGYLSEDLVIAVLQMRRCEGLKIPLLCKTPIACQPESIAKVQQKVILTDAEKLANFERLASPQSPNLAGIRLKDEVEAKAFKPIPINSNEATGI